MWQFIKTKKGIFVHERNKTYVSRIHDKSIVLDMRCNKNLTPQFREQSPYKIHISLFGEDYLMHCDEIVAMLRSFIDRGIINEFKYVDQVLNQRMVEQYLILLEKINAYEQLNENNHVIRTDWMNEFIEMLNTLLKKNFSVMTPPNDADIEKLKSVVEKIIATHNRFFYGDQFTIYIPETVDEELILEMCMTMENYLHNNRVISGILTDVASTLSEYLNFRQEYLLKDFHYINESGENDFTLRINSIPMELDKLKSERRKAVIIEQENSKLFRFLISNLSQAQTMCYPQF